MAHAIAMWQTVEAGGVVMETVVQVAQGRLRGLVENRVHIFKGVPYAVFMLLTVGGCLHLKAETS